MRFDGPTGRVGEASLPSNPAAASSLVSCQAEADGDLSPWARSAGCGGGNLEGVIVRQECEKALRVGEKESLTAVVTRLRFIDTTWVSRC